MGEERIAEDRLVVAAAAARAPGAKGVGERAVGTLPRNPVVERASECLLELASQRPAACERRGGFGLRGAAGSKLAVHRRRSAAHGSGRDDEGKSGDTNRQQHEPRTATEIVRQRVSDNRIDQVLS